MWTGFLGARWISSRALSAFILSFKSISCRLLLVYSGAVPESLEEANILHELGISSEVREILRANISWSFRPGFGTTAVNQLTARVSEHWRDLVGARPRAAVDAVWPVVHSALGRFENQSDWNSCYLA